MFSSLSEEIYLFNFKQYLELPERRYGFGFTLLSNNIEIRSAICRVDQHSNNSNAGRDVIKQIYQSAILTTTQMENMHPDHENWETLYFTLRYISQILFEENKNENIDECCERGALQTIENSFYDVLEENHPTLQLNGQHSNQLEAYALGLNQLSGSIHDKVQIESITALEYKRGMEEGLKFLPSSSNGKLEVDLEAMKLWFPFQLNNETNLIKTKLQEGKGKRKSNSMVLSLLEEQKCKIPMFYIRNHIRDEMFDKVLLWHGDNYECLSGKKIDKEINLESVHLRALLLQCSQAIAMNEYQRAKGLVKDIRKHSSPDGDGVQRIAHIFVSGLDARLAGTGNELYNQLALSCSPTRDILNAHSLLQSASPFIRASFYFANKTIIDVADKAPKMHVIDFGIDFGFQWPCVMQGLSQMKGGAPKLCITAIDIPRPGFSTAQQIEETGRRLEDYARSFNIPFQYNGILVAKWDSICIEDLRIESNEVLVVNSLYRFENLGSETDATECSRNNVLDIIRKIRPHIFVHGIINGSFSDPLFVTRFRQALFHYSAMFDFLDSVVPKVNKQRQFIERVIWAHEAINVIACEGSKRIERPETYKKWHHRNLAAGFEQLPLNPAMIKRAKDRVSEVFNNDFFVEDDHQWLLMGWKGKIIHALSIWRPKQT